MKRMTFMALLAFVASVLVVAMLAAAGCGTDAYVRIEPDPGDAAVSTTDSSSTSTSVAPTLALISASVHAVWPLLDGSTLDLTKDPQEMDELSQAYAAVQMTTPLDASVTPDLVLSLETASGAVEIMPYADSMEQVVLSSEDGAVAGGRSLVHSPELATILEGYRASLRTTEGTTAARAAAANDTADAGGYYVYRIYPSYIRDVLELSWQLENSTLVLWGTIVDVIPSRYNSPDGQPWKPDETVTLPIAYTPVLVQPQEVLKGSPVSLPVAFRWEGGAFGRGADAGRQLSLDTGLEPGDQVLIFGTDSHRYGPGGTYEPRGYWITTGDISMLKRSGAQFTNQTFQITLDEVRALIKEEHVP